MHCSASGRREARGEARREECAGVGVRVCTEWISEMRICDTTGHVCRILCIEEHKAGHEHARRYEGSKKIEI